MQELKSELNQLKESIETCNANVQELSDMFKLLDSWVDLMDMRMDGMGTRVTNNDGTLKEMKKTIEPHEATLSKLLLAMDEQKKLTDLQPTSRRQKKVVLLRHHVRMSQSRWNDEIKRNSRSVG